MGRVDTPERILATALALFNDLGEPNVTTNRIADELDISPGNLHYHFRTKQRLIEALFGRFEHRMLELLATADDAAPGIDDFWILLHLIFETIVEYRFLYRDLTELCVRDHGMHQRFRAILRLSMETADALCNGLTRRGDMEITPLARRGLVRNIVLVSTCWIAFDQVLDPREDPQPDRAAWQVLSLVSPYLRGNARVQLEVLSAAYLSPAHS